MKKRKNKKSAINPQPLELVLDPMDTLMVMEAGTKVSCKLTEVLTSSGSGIIGMSAAVFGLAKVTVLLRHLIARRGYDMSSIYNDVVQFFEEYAETEECQKSFEKFDREINKV